MPPDIAHCAVCNLPLFEAEGSLALRWSDTRLEVPFGIGRVELCSWVCATRFADEQTQARLRAGVQP